MEKPDIKQIMLELKNKSPLVHCMTNDVANARVADILSAIGASPLMANEIKEVGTITKNADALTVNIGTLTSPQLAAMKVAMKAATDHDRPIVLDPVAHFASSFRQEAIQELLLLKPQIIRGNASEILGLTKKSAGRGVDNLDLVQDAVNSAINLANRQNCIVSVSGTKDFVTNGTESLWIEGGHPLMEKVPALGCALTGVIGAFSAIAPLFQATVVAHCVFAYAGRHAATEAKRPGSFYTLFLDHIYNLSLEQMYEETILYT